MQERDAVTPSVYPTREGRAGGQGARRMVVAVLLLLALTGCLARKRKPSNENFKRAINAYFYNGRDECLFPTAIKFPNEVKITEKEEMRQMDALAKAGLLTRIEDGAFKLVRYSPTPLGTRATARFCYGHRDVTSIDSYTPPRPVEGRQASDVTYRYRLVDSPQWAEDDALKKVFPKLATETAASPVGKTTVMTAYDRWEVPDYGAPVIQ